MDKVRLEILGMTYSESSSGAYVLILGEKPGVRRLPIVIGGPEADSIAIGLEGKEGNRPLTHDLMLNFAKEFNIWIKEVVIHRFRDGVFYASIICQQGVDLAIIDARPSDAIALAVRAGCDIYAYESVMQEASIVMDDFDEDAETSDDDNINNKVEEEARLDMLTLDELEDLLQMAIADEDYQKAAQIRDEINSRKQ